MGATTDHGQRTNGAEASSVVGGPSSATQHSVLSTQHYPEPTAAGELFGFERLAASATYWTARAESAEGIAEGIWSDVTDWSGETSTHDDMTLLVAKPVSDRRRSGS